ncbi:MAG: hypothetical protein QM786_06210 [Breznakibacter sp.]
MATRELEKVRNIILESTGLDLAYAYDDLVFAEHGIFIVQFDAANPKYLHVFFNHECWEEERKAMQKSFSEIASIKGFVADFKGLFKMQQKHATEEIELKFIR